MEIDAGSSLAPGLVDEFAALVEAGKFAEAEKPLTAIKLHLLKQPTRTPADKALGQRALETAVLMSVKAEDLAGFDRHVQQLKPYYADPAVPSQQRPTILGLYLLFLIVENRLAEFHSELEALTSADRDTSPEIAFAINLEQSLMVGTYNQVLSAKAHMPSTLFEFFLVRLLTTVRETIAGCAEVAYESLSVGAARSLMMFDTEADFIAFAAAAHPTWTLANGRVTFDQAAHKKSCEIPSIRLITESLAYATELERIV